jgi:DNA-binding transcriptional LysR family regulator
MKDWSDLKFVLALSRAKTMKAAAEMLGTNAATVSRRLDKLTNEVGKQLFTMDTDGWRPTRETQALVELAMRIEADLDQFDNLLAKPASELSGTISISCYQGISILTLAPKLASFHERFPNLNLDIEYRPNRSLARGEIDLAIRLDLPKEGRLVSKRVGSRVSAYYTRKGNTPGKDWVGLAREFDDLPMMKQGVAYFECDPVARLGSLSEIEQTLLNSKMAGPQLSCSVNGHGKLDLIDDPRLISVKPIHLFYHETRRNDTRLQAVKSWIENCFAGPTACMCGKCSFPVETGINV